MDLKLFRKSCKLSQSYLADLFDCSVGHISNIESGNRSITAFQIRLLIDKYGYDVISRYCDPSELPARPIIVHAPNVHDNKGQVNTGGTNTQNITPANNDLINVLKQQSTLLSNQSAQITTLLEQQARLIAMLEQK